MLPSPRWPKGSGRAARDERRRRRRSPPAMKAGTAATGTETSCLIEPPSWRCTSPNISRMRQNILAWSRLSAIVASSTRPRSRPVGQNVLQRCAQPGARPATTARSARTRDAAAAADRGSRRRAASTSSTPIRGISSKLVTPPRGALGRETEQLERRLRRGHADERGLHRARPRQQPQHRRGDDAERAFRADEQVLAGRSRYCPS